MSQSRGSDQNWRARDYGTMSSSGPSGDTNQGADIASLSESVATNIQTIKNHTIAIERVIKVIGTPQDNAQYREDAYESQKRTKETIRLATQDLATLTRLVRSESKQRRLMVDKLSNDYETILKKYSESQSKLVTKMRKTLLVAEYETNEAEASNDSQLMQQQQLQYQLQLSDARTRELQMREIESVVVDVNDIMLQLASQITEQGHAINTIESSIENVQDNIEQGTSELQKAATYQNKYRKKVLILLIIAIIVGAIIVSIIISGVKN